MVDAGVHVRLYTFIALIVLQVRRSLQVLPLFSAANTGDVHSIVASSLLPAYSQLKDKAGHLTCLKFLRRACKRYRIPLKNFALEGSAFALGRKILQRIFPFPGFLQSLG